MSPADVVDTAEEAAAETHPPLIVRRPLEAFLDGHGLGEGEIQAERIGDGHSNLNFLITRGTDRYVLRRPPRPPLPPSAHDVLREARVLRAIESTPARVPPVPVTSEDGEHGEGILGWKYHGGHGHVEFNDYYGRGQSDAYLRKVSCHEIGHYVGLDHSDDATDCR